MNIFSKITRRLNRPKVTNRKWDFNVKKTMSRQAFTKLCVKYADSFQRNQSGPECAIMMSVRLIFELNNLDKKFIKLVAEECMIAAGFGWEKADEILKDLAENGGAWDENEFDSYITSKYLQLQKVKHLVIDMMELQAIRWAFNHGARCRVQYHDYDTFLKAFQSGDLYDTEIKFFTETNRELMEDVVTDKVMDSEAGMRVTNRYRKLFEVTIDTMGTDRLKKVCKGNDNAVGMFFGGMVVSSITQGSIDMSSFPDMDEEKRNELTGLCKTYIAKIAGQRTVDFFHEDEALATVVFMLGMYVNQVAGEGKQVIPYDLNYDTLDRALKGDPTAQVMMFGEK